VIFLFISVPSFRTLLEYRFFMLFIDDQISFSHHSCIDSKSFETNYNVLLLTWTKIYEVEGDETRLAMTKENRRGHHLCLVSCLVVVFVQFFLDNG
jgi:hypothetical protein